MGQVQGVAAGADPSDQKVNELYGKLKESFLAESEGVNQEQLLWKLREKLQADVNSAMGIPRISPDVLDTIGQTPLVSLRRFCPEKVGEVCAKVEYFNPGCSVKDRIAREMLEDAEAKGIITPGKTVVVDLTSGNTGIAWGLTCASRGYRSIQVIPEPYSVERRAMMLALGVEIVVTPKAAGIGGAMKKYLELCELENAWSPRQFDNPANIQAHFTHTGPEIWEQTGGKVDVLICGYGTGGTLSGAGSYLKERNPNLRIIAVEPKEQSLLNGDKPGPHGIQGIVPPFIPENVRVEILDEVVRVSTEEAMATSRELARTEGIACGISAGANVCAATLVAKRPEMAGKRIVTIMPSYAERYMSTPLYSSICEAAKSIELATINPDIDVSSMNLNTLDQVKAKRTFKEGFHVN